MKVVLEFLWKFGPLAWELLAGVVKTLRSGKLSKEDALNVLVPYLDESATKALLEILDSPDLRRAYDEADDVLQ